MTILLPEGLCLKNSNDTIENLTGGLPACSAVRQLRQLRHRVPPVNPHNFINYIG
jgi:hypothetical protein